jgi:nitroimidazol reductase NimA-like FMN-containing flavoprotein (pyridoxamine 5'-phosphate oxidase superfamily)
MRRKDREITDLNSIVEIIRKCDTCRISLFDEEYPYIIPMNFGFEKNGDQLMLYFHAAHEGKKIDLIKKCNRASFEMDCSHRLITGEKACDYTMEYESVCGTGIIEILEPQDRVIALKHLMKQYSSKDNFEFSNSIVNAVTVLRLKVNSITGKRSRMYA